jgi:hypothetical protein
MVSGIGQGLLLGMAQTVRDNKCKEFLQKGVDVLREQITSLNELLTKENLNTPRTYTTDVLPSTQSPFSDKLAMFCVITTLGDIISSFSFAKISSMRKDLHVSLTVMEEKLTIFLGEGVKLMINNEWFEELPKNVDRRDLIRS